MLYNYVYRQQPSYLMEFKCNFHFMPVFTEIVVVETLTWEVNKISSRLFVFQN